MGLKLEDFIRGMDLAGSYVDDLGNQINLEGRDYTSTQELQNLMRMNSSPKQIFQQNDVPLDDPFQEYGGRISSGFPIGDNERLTLGLSGSGFNSPEFNQPLRPTGIDATYQSGDYGGGVSYEQLNPQQKTLLFNLFKEF